MIHFHRMHLVTWRKDVTGEGSQNYMNNQLLIAGNSIIYRFCLQEVIEGLNIQPDGIYVDCTFGGGGHSKAILGKLSEKGKLVAFDQDEDARKKSAG